MKTRQLPIIVLLALLTAACTGTVKKKNAPQDFEQMEKEVAPIAESLMKEFMLNHLADSESYEPQQTHLLPLPPREPFYDVSTYRCAKSFLTYVDDYRYFSTRAKSNAPDAEACARKADDIQNDIARLRPFLMEMIADVMQSKPEFEGIIAKHSCHFKSRKGTPMERTFVFVIRPDKRVVLLDDTETMQRVRAFTDSLTNGLIDFSAGYADPPKTSAIKR